MPYICISEPRTAGTRISLNMRFHQGTIVSRLRWVMLGTMLFSMMATLAGQPLAFWHHPEQAIRFDGLSIYDHTNVKFEFFLGHGWLPYVIACLIYFAAAFVLVSVLPRTLGVMAVFSFIFGHFYGGSNWLMVHWHSGMQGFLIYELILATLIALALAPALEDAPLAVKRLPWIAAGALIIDFCNTLIGQPHSYWCNPTTAYEANALSRYFLMRGWAAFCVYDIVYCALILLVASALPQTGALISSFAFLLGGYVGATNWFFYVWRMGIKAPILYAIFLAGAVSLAAFADQQRDLFPNSALRAGPQPDGIT